MNDNHLHNIITFHMFFYSFLWWKPGLDETSTISHEIYIWKSLRPKYIAIECPAYIQNQSICGKDYKVIVTF